MKSDPRVWSGGECMCWCKRWKPQPACKHPFSYEHCKPARLVPEAKYRLMARLVRKVNRTTGWWTIDEFTEWCHAWDKMEAKEKKT